MRNIPKSRFLLRLVVFLIVSAFSVIVLSAFAKLEKVDDVKGYDPTYWQDADFNASLQRVNNAKNSVKTASSVPKSNTQNVTTSALPVKQNAFAYSFFPPDDTTKKVSDKKTVEPVKDSLAKGGKGKGKDSIKVNKDSIRIDGYKKDSTARLKYFKTVRKDWPTLSLYSRKSSAFYTQPTSKKKIVEIDSVGDYVIIKEQVGSEKTKVVLRLPFEQYLKQSINANEDKLWDDLSFAYTMKASNKDLNELIKNITDFEIPLPKVGILSIFGPNIISLKIGGAVDIRAAFRNETTEGITASNLGNTRNEPDFKQQVQINVNGTIGDKLNIVADWNTERTFEYENQLKIKYTGYEDEIIQSVEAGNVSLQASSLVGSSEALFGVKANFKIGPLNLTALLSQKKSEVKEKSVSGGSQSQTYAKRAYDYSTNHFFIDKAYADTTENMNLFYKYYGNPVPIVNDDYRVVDIEVWKTITQSVKSPDERNANAFINLTSYPTGQGSGYSDTLRSLAIAEIPGEQVKGRFIKLVEGTDYIIHRETGFLTFKTQILDIDNIAVAYKIGSANFGQTFGEFVAGTANDTSKRLVLKLIKPAYLQPTMDKAWGLMLKNIYALGGRNLKQEGFEFNIKYEVEGSEAQTVLGDTKLLNAFGLDLYSSSGNPPSDGTFDYRAGTTILPETGEIIFPKLAPFGASIPRNLPNADSIRYNNIYTQTLTFAKNDRLHDKWVLTGKYSGEASSVYQLSYNMVENSVKVFLNGRELTAGSDYIVDYNIGQLTIREASALVPGANLRITYEENDLVQMASKSLFGLRGVFDISKKTKLGFTAMTLSQQTLSDKVRIGEEPLSNSIYGIDFQTSADLPWLTRAIDKVFSTREMSSITLNGEMAYMRPDPNTKKSTIASDNGKSIAYIDDFEGSKRTIPIGIQYGGWKDLSVPDQLPQLTNLTKLQSMKYKGKSWWFNYLPSDVRVTDIWPNKTTVSGEDQVTVLDFAFLPDSVGSYNREPDLSNNRNMWGGMMKLLSSNASNLTDENIEYIEFWLHVRSAEPNAKVYVDIGKISEDVIPNHVLDSEDKEPKNDLIDEGEDQGLDGLNDDQERAQFGNAYQDPSHDNFVYSSGSGGTNIYRYYNINGTQGNAILTDLGRIPDSEDLNRNGVLDEANSYFRYEIPLDTNSTTNKYIAGGGGKSDHWFLYRIPLKDYALKVGSPSFSLVEYVRFFTTNVDTLVSIRIADFNLVGNQWRKAIENDSAMSISVVSVEDNPDYILPPGVSQERDKTRPDQKIYRNEQAMNLILNSLPAHESREAVKTLYRPLDVFNYSEMKLFIHADDINLPGYVSNWPNGTPSADVYFRFGADTNNYYEYRRPVKYEIMDAGAPGWSEIDIVFKDLTAIKQTRDSATGITTIDVPDKPGHYYRVKGNPSLTAVKFLSVGIANRTSYSLIGRVWINELRVIGADDTPGFAYSGSAVIKFADILNVNVNYSKTDPFFHRLNDRFGSRNDSKSWGLNTDLDILKLMPFSLPGSNLRLNYSHSESINNPTYMPGTDVKVDEAIELVKEKNLKNGMSQLDADAIAEKTKTETQTVSVNDSWSLSGVQIKVPSDYWLLKYSLNALSYGFNYNKTFSRSPSVTNSETWLWNANMNYGINLPDYSFTPSTLPYIGAIFDLFSDYKESKIYFAPQNFAWQFSAKRSYSYTQTRAIGTSQSTVNIARDFQASRGFSYNWKLTDKALLNIATTYSMSINSSLTYLETDELNNARSESQIWGDIFKGDMFGKDYQMSQSFDIKTSPRLPSWFDINKYFNINAGYNVRYNWANNFTAAEVGRSAGFNNRINLGVKLRWKALTAPLFVETVEKEAPPKPVEPQRRDRTRDLEDDDKPIDGEKTPPTSPEKMAKMPKDTVLVAKDTIKRVSALKNAYNVAKSTVRVLLFDYESISIDFSNDVNVSNSGIKGDGTGLNNFFGIKQSTASGPSRMYMLGLSHDPGMRAAGNLQDVFGERNNIDIRTSRDLWEGARIDINWKVGWSYSKQNAITVDENGFVTKSNLTATGTVTRSFFTLPPVFVFSVFKSGIKKVYEKYDGTQESMSAAFVSGFESMPLLGSSGFLSDFANYIPRPNWHISWDGLEKWNMFKSFAKRVSIEHSYSADYTEGWKLSADGTKQVQTQRISYSFAPLLGVNITFNNLWGGNFSGNVKYSTRSGYDLSNSTTNVTESFSRDIGITVNYNKSGFELPLFGVSLKNDLEFSFTYSNAKNSSVLYDFAQWKEDGTPQNGTSTVSYEPRIKYVLSSRVTMTIFYKRTQTTPEGASKISPTTRNEAGVDIRISIQ